MNPVITAKLIEQTRQLEDILFPLHRDSGDKTEHNQLGEAWICAKKLRESLEKVETDRKSRIARAQAAMADPVYAEAMRIKEETPQIQN